MSIAQVIINEMSALYNDKQAANLSRFFKTGKGEYGEGDKFLGIKVPTTRSIVKKYRKEVSLKEIETLINSKWHEIRLAGFLLLLDLYKESFKTGDKIHTRGLVDFYLANIQNGNNWDQVDLVAPYILGDWVMIHPEFESLLIDLANKEGYLWHQRVAIVSTLPLIKSQKFDITFLIAAKFIYHPHDLIHKATGWMLREVGKRGGKKELVEFLEKHKYLMPRTMLRYAIEKFSEEERKYFLRK